MFNQGILLYHLIKQVKEADYHYLIVVLSFMWVKITITNKSTEISLLVLSFYMAYAAVTNDTSSISLAICEHYWAIMKSHA